jgi:hypothetical protein
MKSKLQDERGQLLGHWKKGFNENPDWMISDELYQVQIIFRASNGNENAQKLLKSNLRQFHDKLGFKAKDSLRQGGLCAGAIFRTQAFIETEQEQRIGSKCGQSVHIEHTVPINKLEGAIISRHFPNLIETLSWLLKHSVATAFHEREKEHLRGVTIASGALDPTSSEYLRPFLRYAQLHKAGSVVWNVFDGQKIDPVNFTFKDHLEIVLRLLHEAGASGTMLSDIRSGS